jgi:quinoprotein relay system zinc metallohydrolase 1
LLDRRKFLGLAGAGCGCAMCGSAGAQPLRYHLDAHEIAPHTWGVFGAREHFSLSNGGNIVNVAFVVAPEGVIVIDTGPSRRFGETLLKLIAAKAPGKPILRVFNTHHHPDHFLGNQVFDREVIAAPQKVIDNIAAQGDDFASNMYRLVGDWMRGTTAVAPAKVIATSREEIGGRAFHYMELSGHTNCDFVLRDEETGVLFTGDLAFLNRAPTTPQADIPAWRAAIATLRKTDRALILPGHGPQDSKGASLDQTLDWLDWLDGTLRDCVSSGLTMNEAMQRPLPARFAAIGVAREEFQRSVVHLYPLLEEELIPSVEVDRD